MGRKENNLFEKTVTYTTQLHGILKAMNIRDHTGIWLQFLHFNQKMDNQQVLARSLMDKIIASTLEQNSSISSRLIYDRIVYELLGKAIWFPDDYQDFSSSARAEIRKLVEYNSSRPVNIPLVHLKVKVSPTKFGLIEFHNINQDDLKDEWWEKIANSGGTQDSTQAYARIEVAGDHENSLTKGRTIVEDMLIFLRAISFPLTAEAIHQFGLLNEFPSLLVLPFKIGKPKENYKLEYSVQYSSLLGPPTFSYCLEEDFLSQVDRLKIEKINKAIEDDYFDPSTDLKRKFFLGLRWLGEATKPDNLESRFVKLFFSFEALIGGGIRNSRETKIILAKRCANLLETSQEEKDKIYNKILKYYTVRSEIVHGSKNTVSDHDFSDFGLLVRKTTWALLSITDHFENIEDLHNSLLGPSPKQRKTLMTISLNDLRKWFLSFFIKK